MPQQPSCMCCALGIPHQKDRACKLFILSQAKALRLAERKDQRITIYRKTHKISQHGQGLPEHPTNETNLLLSEVDRTLKNWSDQVTILGQDKPYERNFYHAFLRVHEDAIQSPFPKESLDLFESIYGPVHVGAPSPRHPMLTKPYTAKIMQRQ
ncbi:hypothetical protein B0O99DRAFT_726521 [Bisporella sp. PMI_857]|nr:hypothetical protein B0O99DRAFT_726521 [Bisporella sp. PMI_857]